MIQLLLPSNANAFSLLQRSAGTQIVASDMAKIEDYERDAIVPRKPFAPIPTLHPHPHQADHPFIALVSLRDAILRIIAAFPEAFAFPEATHLAARIDIGDLISECLQALAGAFHWSPSQFKTIGLVISEPDRTTITMDRTTGRRLGIHLDSWDASASMDDRIHTRNRICINIGSGTRHFLFCAVTAPAIHNAIAPCHRPTESVLGRPVTPTDYVRLFLSRRPEIPVYRLSLPPGWAYIAPAELIPHDACAPPQQYDFALHAMANFLPTPQHLQATQLLTLDAH